MSYADTVSRISAIESRIGAIGGTRANGLAVNDNGFASKLASAINRFTEAPTSIGPKATSTGGSAISTPATDVSSDSTDDAPTTMDPNAGAYGAGGSTGSSGGLASVGAAPAPSADEEQAFEASASKYGVDLGLAKAVGRAESGFREQARSAAGALGVMQLMPATARGLGVTNPLDASQNIDGGVKYLSQLLTRFHGDRTLAIAAYNAGPGAVAKAGGVPDYAETKAYVQRVSQYAQQYGRTDTTGASGL